MIEVRKITQDDYQIISKWCKDWGFPDLTQAEGLLPDIGYIASKEGNDIYCGFLYLTNSSFAHPEWIISNKKYKDKASRKEAFSKLFEVIEQDSRNRGYKLFLMSVKDRSLIKKLKEIDFVETDINMTNLIKAI